jgi:PilZ domain
MDAKERRRSDRVSLLSPIRVSGTDAAGEAFSAEGRTLLVTLHGAAIILGRKLQTDQPVTIRCYGTETEAAARVVGQIEGHTDGLVYGVQFLDPAVNPWNIKFPAAPSSDTVGRLLLHCTNCLARELVYLNELELEVFGANQCLSRPCAVCQKATLWKATPQEESAGEAPDAGAAEAPESAASLVPRARNDRQHVRLRLKLKACIRHAELGEEVVECEDVSRGGICFTSQRQYPKDSMIEASVPYLPGQANIFTRARIANLRPLAGEAGRFKYGVNYISG